MRQALTIEQYRHKLSVIPEGAEDLCERALKAYKNKEVCVLIANRNHTQIDEFLVRQNKIWEFLYDLVVRGEFRKFADAVINTDKRLMLITMESVSTHSDIYVKAFLKGEAEVFKFGQAMILNIDD